MTEIREAIEHFRQYIHNDVYTDKMRKYCKLAIEALKKAEMITPEDPYMERMAGDTEYAMFGSCPRCKREVQEGENYCSECGQALNWE